LHKKYLPILR